MKVEIGDLLLKKSNRCIYEVFNIIHYGGTCIVVQERGFKPYETCQKYCTEYDLSDEFKKIKTVKR